MSESSLQEKQVKAHAIVGATTAAAAVTGGIPLPIVDMIPLIGEQVAMLGGITAVFGFDLKKSALTSLVYAALNVSGAAFIGKTVVSSVLKVIPFAGTFAGGAVSATTAGTLTLVMGEAYIKLLSGIAGRGDDIPPIDDLIDDFKVLVKNERQKQEEQETGISPAPEPETGFQSEPEPAAPSEPESGFQSEPEAATPPEPESNPAPPFKIRFE
ncbi:MAG: DUF697 domain-containing protein [Oscillospiraceae bacterium]|nr:DUF697 domain-containing protein [Oscillospiraceae bacterium]